MLPRLRDDAHVVISIGKTTRIEQAVDYLVEAAADQQLDHLDYIDYYASSARAGRWAGAGAEPLGLRGAVTADQLRSMLHGQHPLTGQPLGRRFGSQRVVAFDVTFSIPKSVSILYALGDNATREAVVAAHEKAVDAVCTYLQEHAGSGRRLNRQTGTIDVVPAKMVMPRFLHRTARPVTDPATRLTTMDPQLHTHVLVPTWVQRDDGSWGQLYSQPLYREAAAAGTVGQAVLRHWLVELLGIRAVVLPNGCFEIEGITQEQRDEFSRRTRQIDELEELLGFDSLTGRRLAVIGSRQRKGDPRAGADVFSDWRRRGASVGLDNVTLESLTGHAVERTSGGLDISAGELLGPTGLTAQAATFRRRDVVRAVATHAPWGMSLADIEERVDTILADATLIVPLLPDPDSGEPVAAVAARLRTRGTELRFSTPEMVALERDMLSLARTRQAAEVAVASAADVDAAVADQERVLTDDQRSLVDAVCLSGDGVTVIEGPAGTGKTAALAVCRAAFERSGYKVIGVSLAARAATELSDAAGIESFTAAFALLSLREHPLPAGSVLIVEEAGMIGSRTVWELVAIAARDNAKMVLVGDSGQVQPIDAGAAFRALGDHLGRIELRQVVRQEAQWEVEALTALRRGGATTATQAFLEHDRVRVARNARERRMQMVADYNTARERGEDAIMLARAGRDVAQLNSLARATALLDGRLGDIALRVGDREFRAGDPIICLRNRLRNRLTNGTRGVVIDVDPSHHALTIRTTRGRDLIIDTRRYAHLDYAYALTVHKAQGMTCDVVLVLGSDFAGRQWTYTALSRSRFMALYYIVEHPLASDPEGMRHWEETTPNAKHRMAAAWSRDESKDSTLDFPDAYEGPETPPLVYGVNLTPPTDHQLGLIEALGGWAAALPDDATWLHASLLIDRLSNAGPGGHALAWLQESGLDADDAQQLMTTAAGELDASIVPTVASSSGEGPASRHRLPAPSSAQLEAISALGGDPIRLPPDATWPEAALVLDVLQGQPPGQRTLQWLLDAGVAASAAETITRQASSRVFGPGGGLAPPFDRVIHPPGEPQLALPLAAPMRTAARVEPLDLAAPPPVGPSIGLAP
jgi:conjugative relaxase-like TrwC/TraI family protein